MLSLENVVKYKYYLIKLIEIKIIFELKISK